MKIYILSSLCLLLLTACYKNPETPAPKIPEDKMIAVLADIHIAEALLTEISPGLKKDSMAQFYYQQIYYIHNIEPEDFDQSMEVYMQKPFVLDSLFTKVITKLGEDAERFTPKIKKQ